jgi:pimeloyl-ACP methyl ester carboxylesterase
MVGGCCTDLRLCVPRTAVIRKTGGSRGRYLSRSIQAGDERVLTYAEWGDREGAPVISIHGTPGSRLDRPYDEEEIKDLGIHLITYDRPGYGASDRRQGRRIVDCVSDVADIADELGIERFAVTGGSGGGPHVLAVAARLGDRVTRAQCHVGLAPFGLDDLDFFQGMDPENVRELEWALEGEDRLAVECAREAQEYLLRLAEDPASILENFDLPESDLAILADPRDQEITRQSSAEMFANGLWGWIDDDLAFVQPWGFDVREIDVPVEIRFGADDVLVPASHGHWLGAHVPGARVIKDTGGGHLTSPDDAIERLRQLALGV